MAISFEKIETAQAEFNKKYGVNFDIAGFDESIGFFAGMGGASNADDLYQFHMISLSKKAYANFIDRKIGDQFDFVQMIDEFDKTIMEPYRNECRKEEEKTPPKPYGGWKLSEYLTSVDDALSDVPAIKFAYAQDRYRQGKLTLNDMKEYMNQLKQKGDNVSLGELSTMDCYLTALSNEHKNRSFINNLWPPFRYLFEMFALKSFKSYLEEKTGGPLSIQEGVNPTYARVSELSDDGMIGTSKEIVRFAKTQALEREQAREELNSQKQPLSVGDAATDHAPAKIIEKAKSTDVPQKNNLKGM